MRGNQGVSNVGEYQESEQNTCEIHGTWKALRVLCVFKLISFLFGPLFFGDFRLFVGYCDYCSDFFLFIFLAALLTTGEVFQFVSFCQRFPHVLLHILTFSLASAIGQVWYSIYVIVMLIKLTFTDTLTNDYSARGLKTPVAITSFSVFLFWEPEVCGLRWAKSLP